MVRNFSLLASALAGSHYLASVFSLRAFDRARGLSLVMAEAGRPGFPRMLGTLLRHERKLAVVVLL